MAGSAGLRKVILSAYLMVVALILLLGQMSAPVENTLIFVSDTDSIDASRESNSAYRIELDGSGMKRIVGSIRHGDDNYIRIRDVSCQPSSQVMAIAGGRHDLNGFHIVNLDGSQLRQVDGGTEVSLRAVQQIALALDGSQVLLSREFTGVAKGRFGLIRGDYRSGEYLTIKAPAVARSYTSAVWSPDGRQIGYVIKMTDGGSPVYAIAIAAADGSQERIIHQTTFVIEHIDWSADGEWIAAGIGMQVYKLRPDGSELTRLTNHHAGLAFPRWSPDGRQISYVAPSFYLQHHQLMVMDADGGNIRRVANIRGGLVNGCWV